MSCWDRRFLTIIVNMVVWCLFPEERKTQFSDGRHATICAVGMILVVCEAYMGYSGC